MSVTDHYLEYLCEVMHDAYEAAAVKEGWETQERSRKPWSEVPEANKATMRAAVAAMRDEVLEQVATEINREKRWQEEQRRRSIHPDTRLTHRYMFDRLTIVAEAIRHRLGAPILNPPRSNHDAPAHIDLPEDLEARSPRPADG